MEMIPDISRLNPSLLSSFDDEKIGSRLMGLVRSMEKATGDSRSEEDMQVSDMIKDLIAIYSHRGLLLGNNTTAQKRLETTTALNLSSTGRNKRSRSSGKEESDTTQDETLLISALLRILKSRNAHLVALSANVLRAISEHIQECNEATKCAKAEKEILLASSRPILTQLGSTMEGLMTQGSGNATLQALSSCLQTATSLIGLFGTKLAHSGSVVSTIRQVAWNVLLNRNATVQHYSVALLSTLPLTGADKKAPAQLWSASVMDTVSTLSMFLDAIAPVRKQKQKNSVSNHVEETVVKCLDISDAQDEGERVAILLSRVQGLTAHLVALLTREAYSRGTCEILMAARVPVQDMIGLAEKMISMPSAAESLYFSTKKRLAREKMQNGLVSPAVLVHELANSIKSCGHSIFDATIAAVGRSSLLPFGRRILKIAHSSLLASSSTTLQEVVDPTMTGKRKKWLHTSVALRVKAIQTYSNVIRVLGPSIVACSLEDGPRAGTNSSNEISKAISIIAGSLLEQIVWPCRDVSENGDDMATLSVRVDLATAALNTLTEVLATGGGYLSFSSRSLIDSIASTCLPYLSNNSQITSWPAVKMCILNLGSACLCTPWPDGAASGLRNDLGEVARICCGDVDTGVAACANALLKLCDALATPRATPLKVVTRSNVPSDSRSAGTRSATSLIEDLKSAREETALEANSASLTGGAAASLKDPEENSEETKANKSEQTWAAAAAGEKVDTNVASNVSSTKYEPEDAKMPARRSLPEAAQSNTRQTKRQKKSKKEGERAVKDILKDLELAEKAVERPTGASTTTLDSRKPAPEEVATAAAPAFSTTRESAAPTSNTTLESAATASRSGLGYAAKPASDDSDDDDFPEIVDCDPDEEDK